MAETKTVRKGRLVTIRRKVQTSGPWSGLVRPDGELAPVISMDARSESLYMVLTDPKMVVKSGHELLVVDLLGSDGDVQEDFLVEFLEVVS